MQRSYSYKFKILTDYLTIERAVQAEAKFLSSYIAKGWKAINIAPAGSLGGTNIKWTKETCILEAKKYKSRTEFKKKSSGAYSAAITNGWQQDIFRILPTLQKPSGYWTKQRCAIEAKKFNKKSDFKSRSSAAAATRPFASTKPRTASPRCPRQPSRPRASIARSLSSACMRPSRTCR